MRMAEAVSSGLHGEYWRGCQREEPQNTDGTIIFETLRVESVPLTELFQATHDTIIEYYSMLGKLHPALGLHWSHRSKNLALSSLASIDRTNLAECTPQRSKCEHCEHPYHQPNTAYII